MAGNSLIWLDAELWPLYNTYATWKERLRTQIRSTKYESRNKSDRLNDPRRQKPEDNPACSRGQCRLSPSTRKAQRTMYRRCCLTWRAWRSLREAQNDPAKQCASGTQEPICTEPYLVSRRPCCKTKPNLGEVGNLGQQRRPRRGSWLVAREQFCKTMCLRHTRANLARAAVRILYLADDAAKQSQSAVSRRFEVSSWAKRGIERSDLTLRTAAAAAQNKANCRAVVPRSSWPGGGCAKQSQLARADAGKPGYQC